MEESRDADDEAIRSVVPPTEKTLPIIPTSEHEGKNDYTTMATQEESVDTPMPSPQLTIEIIVLSSGDELDTETNEHPLDPREVVQIKMEVDATKRRGKRIQSPTTLPSMKHQRL